MQGQRFVLHRPLKHEPYYIFREIREELDLSVGPSIIRACGKGHSCVSARTSAGGILRPWIDWFLYEAQNGIAVVTLSHKGVSRY